MLTFLEFSGFDPTKSLSLVIIAKVLEEADSVFGVSVVVSLVVDSAILVYSAMAATNELFFSVEVLGTNFCIILVDWIDSL